MGFEFQSTELFGGRFCAGGIVTSIQVSRDGQTSLRGPRTDEVEDLLITFEGFTSPVFGNFGEESMLNGIERLNGEFRRRVKTQSSLPDARTAERLMFGLLISSQIQTRRIDGWQDL